MAPDIGEPPYYYPSMKEMIGSFERYVESVEAEVSEIGACRITPPAKWKARKAGYDTLPDDLTIDKPIKQHATGRRGLFRTLLIEAKTMNAAKEFKVMADLPENKVPDKIVSEGLNVRAHDWFQSSNSLFC